MNRSIRYFFNFILIFSLIFTFVFGGFTEPIKQVEASQELQNAQADKAALEAELSNLEQQIAQKQADLNNQKGQSTSLSRDIAILTTQIKKAQLEIKSKNLTIKKLGGEITQKNTQIQTLTTKIETEKESLSQIIRKDRELDNKSLITLILSQDNISDAYGDIDTFASIKKDIKSSVDTINGVKVETESEKQTLQKQKDQVVDVKNQLVNVQTQVQSTEAQKQQLLSISKNKEAEYQKVLAAQAARRAQILAMLFDLRDASAIPFSKALEYANLASKATGVEPAFLLAIIQQESNFGTDQGSCYLTNMSTGAGVSSHSGRTYPNVMKPTRDVGPFNDITTALGRDPYKTLVSCPIASAGSSSWGGAMGPAQFIPSTWKLIAARVASALSINTPDPWYPRDSFMASALFLSDLGAIGNSYTAEIRAACKYYGSGGSSCSYGKQVMKRRDNIQNNMINPLQS